MLLPSSSASDTSPTRLRGKWNFTAPAGGISTPMDLELRPAAVLADGLVFRCAESRRVPARHVLWSRPTPVIGTWSNSRRFHLFPRPAPVPVPPRRPSLNHLLQSRRRPRRHRCRHPRQGLRRSCSRMSPRASHGRTVVDKAAEDALREKTGASHYRRYDLSVLDKGTTPPAIEGYWKTVKGKPLPQIVIESSGKVLYAGAEPQTPDTFFALWKHLQPGRRPAAPSQTQQHSVARTSLAPNHPESEEPMSTSIILPAARSAV